MKIAIADNTGGKFSSDILNYWQKKGHEVRFERGASEHLAQWADLYYLDWWDNNIHYLYKLYHGDPDKNRPKGWDNNKKPKFVVRAIDWEVWIGFVRDQAIVDWVDEVICIAPHIKKELEKHADFKGKLHLIRPGVNLEKFPFKTKITDGFQLGMVLGDMWWYKNHMGGLDIFKRLSEKDDRWRLHIRGQHEPGEYNPVMFEYYLESRGIKDKVTLYPQVEDINEWYENIDYLLHPGMKEAFSYAVGEAMSKGIKPIVNNFYGARDIWPGDILYNTHEQALSMLNNGHASPVYPKKPDILYRQFIQDNYDVNRMLKEYDALLGT